MEIISVYFMVYLPYIFYLCSVPYTGTELLVLDTDLMIMLSYISGVSKRNADQNLYDLFSTFITSIPFRYTTKNKTTLYKALLSN